MIREVDRLVLQTDSEYIEFNIRTPQPEDSYIVRAISGLQPVVTNVSMTPLTTHGSYFGGIRRESRDIAILIRLNPVYEREETPLSLRARLYNLMNTTGTGHVRVSLFLTDQTQMVTNGYISSFETSLFSNNTEIQISMKCPSAVFENTYQIALNFAADVSPSWPRTYRLSEPFDNSDGADSGVLLTYVSNQDMKEFVCGYVAEDIVSNPQAYLYEPRSSFMHLDTIPNDMTIRTVEIDTRIGSRSIIGIDSSNVRHNLLPYLSRKSEWLAMRSSRLRFFAGSKVEGAGLGTDESQFSSGFVKFQKTYWGV